MWNLVMGAVLSSDEDGGETSTKVASASASQEDREVEQQQLGQHWSRNQSSPVRTAAAKNAIGSSAVVHLHKHRMPSPTRQCGDGSEDGVTAPSASSASMVESPKPPETAAAPPKSKLIHLPQTNIRLEKLPPIRDPALKPLPERTVAKASLVPLTLSPPVAREAASMHASTSASSLSSHHQRKKDKEPKFVPYEPYKGAVTPMVLEAKRRKSSKESTPSPLPNADDAENNGHVSPAGNALQTGPAKRQTDAPTTTAAAAPSLLLHDEPSPVADELKRVLEDKDAEIEALKNKAFEAEKQLRIQMQVNSEVKRLLVASVGEDIEAKVDFLTQDKARLSDEIRTYASKISRDFEEKENLSVESNVWKSKFLASSVIVDELARWKASLLHHTDDYNHQARLLLHEHSVLWASLGHTHSILCQLRAAFDPLALSSSAAAATPDTASLLGLSEHAHRVGQDLRDRLLGETGLKARPPVGKESALPAQMDTPAEEGLKEMLSRSLCDGQSDYSEMASLAVKGAAQPHLTKLGDQLATPSNFKNCTHCQGSVHNI